MRERIQVLIWQGWPLATAIALALVVAPVQAQQAYTPPDADLWQAMAKAFSDLPISLTAHQQIQQIMANVQREAQARAEKKDAK